jgi:hypothetical protein
MKTLLLALVLAAFTRSVAISCDCSAPPPVAEAYAASKVVFVGRCLSGKVVSQQVKGIGEMKHREFTFEVTRLWKGGIEKKQVIVQTGFDSAICGYHFQPGTSYILYCHENKGILSTGLCSRTCAADGQKGEAEARELDTAAAKTKPQ